MEAIAPVVHGGHRVLVDAIEIPSFVLRGNGLKPRIHSNTSSPQHIYRYKRRVLDLEWRVAMQSC